VNPWLLLAIAILWGLSIAASATKWAKLKVAEVRAEYLVRDNNALIEANAAIERLQEEARATEAKRVADMNVIASNYAKGYQNAETRRRADVAAARDGALVLRIPAAALCPGGSETGPPRPAAAGGDGAATVELPRAVAADLLALANDADQVADQLRACQAVVISDRKAP